MPTGIRPLTENPSVTNFALKNKTTQPLASKMLLQVSRRRLQKEISLPRLAAAVAGRIPIKPRRNTMIISAGLRVVLRVRDSLQKLGNSIRDYLKIRQRNPTTIIWNL